ncbi:DUF2512 family protein [Serpentinicella alkaliphila]|uniref:Uncharacterized protein DUF2512 n=1 Tax=Serpentinicella alkaliphila TaxID=1734049 RepID=A0A4R2TPG5_9FIRM|nr:DUF2512 family protein [Serpentinicella alkaliphila]QUH24520.1 DUF2512 family protein [Serpentinicella alkaliphila]TCQ04607.1 uncharacterized protein DUF2512 [Serpentinicella alkaliphila]
MSNTAIALIFKFGMTLIAAWITLGLMNGNPLLWIAIIALVGTAANYIFGDLVVLPNQSNLVASLGDGILAAVLAYIVAMFISNFNTTFSALAIYAAIVAVSEFYFHIFIQNDDKVTPK